MFIVENFKILLVEETIVHFMISKYTVIHMLEVYTLNVLYVLQITFE